jgi:two-component system, OmpR family, response regulator
MTLRPDANLTGAHFLRQLGVRLKFQTATNMMVRKRKEPRPMRLLLIEDDPLIGGAVRDSLSADGHRVDWADRLASAEDHLAVADYDLVLLDLMLPDGSGIPFLRARRGEGLKTPVIILTARDQISDRIEGLNAGADDYLVKPFDLAELGARLHAVHRRASHQPDPVLSFGEIQIEPAARRVTRAGKPVTLTAREWALLDALSGAGGNVLSKTALEDRLYGFGTEIESNALEAHISRLRRKLGRDLIATERGIGYRMNRP